MREYIIDNIDKDIVLNSIKSDIKIEEYYNIINNYRKDLNILIKHEDNIQSFTFNLKEYILEKKNIHYISLFHEGPYLHIILYNDEKKTLSHIRVNNDSEYLLFDNKIIIDDLVIRNNLIENFKNEKKNLNNSIGILNNRVSEIYKKLNMIIILIIILTFLFIFYNIYISYK